MRNNRGVRIKPIRPSGWHEGCNVLLHWLGRGADKPLTGPIACLRFEVRPKDAAHKCLVDASRSSNLRLAGFRLHPVGGDYRPLTLRASGVHAALAPGALTPKRSEEGR